MTHEQYKKQVIDAGVSRLKKFGYPDMTIKNVFENAIYSFALLQFLKDKRNELALHKGYSLAIQELITEIEKNKPND